MEREERERERERERKGFRAYVVVMPSKNEKEQPKGESPNERTNELKANLAPGGGLCSDLHSRLNPNKGH
jgi:hypothetical protein